MRNIYKKLNRYPKRWAETIVFGSDERKIVLRSKLHIKNKKKDWDDFLKTVYAFIPDAYWWAYLRDLPPTSDLRKDERPRPGTFNIYN